VVLVPVLAPYGLDSGSQIVADIVDVAVKTDDWLSLLVDYTKVPTVADLVGCHFHLGQKLPPRRQGRLAEARRHLSLSVCQLAA
jgi:hypothetical protein